MKRAPYKGLDYKMMLSISKIFWLFIILASVWYLFKVIERRKLNTKNKEDVNKKGIDAYKCENCGLWSTGDKCNNKECSKF